MDLVFQRLDCPQSRRRGEKAGKRDVHAQNGIRWTAEDPRRRGRKPGRAVGNSWGRSGWDRTARSLNSSQEAQVGRRRGNSEQKCSESMLI